MPKKIPFNLIILSISTIIITIQASEKIVYKPHTQELQLYNRLIYSPVHDDARALKIKKTLFQQMFPTLIRKSESITYLYYPLHEAVRLGLYNTIQYLMYHGASLNSPNHIGWRPLHLAVRLTDQNLGCKIIRLLCQPPARKQSTPREKHQDPADPNLGNTLGDTPIFFAVQDNKKLIAQLLVELNAHDNPGISGSAARMALDRGDIEMINICTKIPQKNSIQN